MESLWDVEGVNLVRLGYNGAGGRLNCAFGHGRVSWGVEVV